MGPGCGRAYLFYANLPFERTSRCFGPKKGRREQSLDKRPQPRRAEHARRVPHAWTPGRSTGIGGSPEGQVAPPASAAGPPPASAAPVGCPKRQPGQGRAGAVPDTAKEQ